MAKTFKQFRLDNVTATLPTTLEYGEEVYYTDANGNLTLWVGHSDGTAWPVCGYKEWVGVIFADLSAQTVVTLKADFVPTFGTTASLCTISSASIVDEKTYVSVTIDDATTLPSSAIASAVVASGSVSVGALDYAGGGFVTASLFTSIRVYP